jgi:biopolymer transport protein ExbD
LVLSTWLSVLLGWELAVFYSPVDLLWKTGLFVSEWLPIFLPQGAAKFSIWPPSDLVLALQLQLPMIALIAWWLRRHPLTAARYLKIGGGIVMALAFYQILIAKVEWEAVIKGPIASVTDDWNSLANFIVILEPAPKVAFCWVVATGWIAICELEWQVQSRLALRRPDGGRRWRLLRILAGGGPAPWTIFRLTFATILIPLVFTVLLTELFAGIQKMERELPMPALVAQVPPRPHFAVATLALHPSGTFELNGAQYSWLDGAEDLFLRAALAENGLKAARTTITLKVEPNVRFDQITQVLDSLHGAGFKRIVFLDRPGE